MFRILESIAVIEINKDPKKFNATKIKQYEHTDLNSLLKNKKGNHASGS
jgi:hypothetical protein